MNTNAIFVSEIHAQIHSITCHCERHALYCQEPQAIYNVLSHSAKTDDDTSHGANTPFSTGLYN